MHERKRRHERYAFTLIELLVVVSIIALLLGILAPALGGARRAGQSAACQANLRQLAIGAVSWSASNKDLLVGAPGNSARELLNDAGAVGDPIAPLAGINGTAVQGFDWAGPLAFAGYLGDFSEVPRRRDERFAMLSGSGLGEPETRGGPFSVLACPSNYKVSPPFDGSSPQPAGIDGTAFQPQLAMSYTSARDMLWLGQASTRPSWAQSGYWGTRTATCVLSGSVLNSVRYVAATTAVARRTDHYVPRLDRIGGPSKKVFLADGTRYQGAALDTGVDHDITASGGFGGAFSDPGPWLPQWSRAWPNGRNVNGESMASVSFRHGESANRGSAESSIGNVAFYDGHVESTQLKDARSTPDKWLPTGAQVKVSELHESIREQYQQRNAIDPNDPSSAFGGGWVTMW